MNRKPFGVVYLWGYSLKDYRVGDSEYIANLGGNAEVSFRPKILGERFFYAYKVY